MKRPYVKEDVRIRVVRMLQRGYTYVAVAKAHGIGEATVNRIWRRFRQTGKTSLLPRGGGTRPAITPNQQADFEKYVSERPLATYDDLTAGWSKKIGKKISRSAIVRHVLRLGFTRKKVTKKATEKRAAKNRAKASSFKFRVKNLDPKKLVFLDESGFQANQMSRYGRSKKGQPAEVWAPAARSKNFTQVGAIRINGPVIMRGSPRAITRKRFLSFLRCHLFPALRPNDVLVMDNLSSHKHASIRKLARRWNIRLLYLPPYSPELNPIEQVWAWMKQRLRSRLNRAINCFRYAISGAWRKASSLCYESLFRSCGYLQSGHAI